MECFCVFSRQVTIFYLKLVIFHDIPVIYIFVYPVKQGAASMAGRKITVLRQAGAAPDHPIDPSYPEGAYLSNVLLRVL